jgi:glycosyltransferase involved in cell wall biosynthesis
VHHLVYAAEVARRFDEIYPEIRPDLVVFADFGAEGLFLLLRLGAGAYRGTEFLLTINGMNHEVISIHEGKRERAAHSLFDLPHIQTLLAMEDLCVHLAPWIVSPTVCAWEEIRLRLGIRKTARIIPNLVDLDLFSPDQTSMRGEIHELPLDKKDSVGHRFPLKVEMVTEPREPLILFVGRLDRMKGADLLLKAYFEIAEQVLPAIPRIIFIGRDCYWNEYGSTFLEFWKNRIPEKYAGAISFLGQVSHDQIRAYLEKATVAVFPSRWEPFGIVCLEALSMGCPVVVSKGTGLDEVLGPALSEFAVSVTEEDLHPLVDKVLCVLDTTSHTSSERLRERSRELVRQAEKGWLDLLRDIEQKN